MADLLLEIGCEELPAASVNVLAEHLATALFSTLSDAGLADTPARVFATPRRLAVLLENVAAQQADQLVERRGPAVAAAYTDGEPSKALLGFMRSAGVGVDDLSTVSTPKGEWIVVKQTQSGQSLDVLLQTALPEVVKALPMPRRMRWADSSNEFLRPVVWLLAMHGNKVLPIDLLGLSAGNTTRGHRFHAPEPIVIPDASHYEQQLLDAYVLADADKRRQRIVQGVTREAESLGGRAVMDDELVDEVTALVEWPVAMAGKFDSNYLQIPKEALIQTMQENQRYFALLDERDELMPAFITIANLESQNPQIVIDGNERVIRPRFADTMFFWEQDKKRSLLSHKADLGRLLFQEKLGSVADKCDRMQSSAKWLADTLQATNSASAAIDTVEVALAVSLCKCDLNTEIVLELAKMQGIAGRYYALRDGHSPAVAEAMEQHYFPKQAGGPLPAGIVAQLVALADKMDTLVGIFGIGMKPSGAKDPFALRRASLGVVRILIEREHDIDLADFVDVAIASYGSRLESPDRDVVVAYILERLRGYMAEQGYAVDAIAAVLAKQISRPLDIAARLAAIDAFRQTDAATSLAAASKRIGNLLRKVEMPVADTVQSDKLSEAAETALYASLQELREPIEQQLQSGDYATAMATTARLREPVDAFFDGVMVMDDDMSLRNNRLALLKQVRSLCSATADISKLQPQETT